MENQYYLVRGDSDGFYVVEVRGKDEDCWHGFIVYATDEEKVGVGAIEWKDDLQEGFEGRYFISTNDLETVIAEAEQMYGAQKD